MARKKATTKRGIPPKFTAAQAKQIQGLLKNGWTVGEVAERFSAHPNTIRNVKHRRGGYAGR